MKTLRRISTQITTHEPKRIFKLLLERTKIEYEAKTNLNTFTLLKRSVDEKEAIDIDPYKWIGLATKNILVLTVATIDKAQFFEFTFKKLNDHTILL